MRPFNRFNFQLLIVVVVMLIVGLGAVALVPAATMPAQASNAGAPTNSQASAKGGLAKLVGSWQVETTVVKQGATFPALISFTSDGLVLADEPPSPFETTGHGAWVATGSKTADFTFLSLVGSETGPLSATLKVVGTLEYDASADTWAGPFKIQIVDASGAEVLVDDGTFDATRIAVESLDTAASVPATTLPAIKPGDKIGEMAVAKGPVPFDLNLPPYPAFCNPNPMLDLGSTVAKPGKYTVECSAPPLPQMVIGYGVTARDAKLLDDVWAATSTELYVNDLPIDQSAFGSLDADVPVTGMPGQDPNEVLNLKLRVWNVILENLKPGDFTMRLVWHISQDVFDGDITWPAGDYDVNYKITVDPSLAVSEGTPEPVELVRQPVEFVRKIDTSAQKITNPVSLAVDGAGNVYVTDAAETPRVLKYDSQGNFVMAWGSRGSGEGQFEFLPPSPDDGPTAGFVATDTKGNVYVSDAYNFRVQKFDANGKFLMQFGSTGAGEGQFEGGPGPIYVDGQGNIYISTFPRVQKFDSTGKFLVAYGTAGTGDGEFTGAALGTLDSQGNMYVADLLNARVQKFDPNGKFLLKWGSAGTGAGQFNMPVAVVIDHANRLYVADNSGRIQVFTTNGEFQGQWSETGDGNPPLDGEISGLAIDRQDNIYVADLASPGIYVYRPR